MFTNIFNSSPDLSLKVSAYSCLFELCINDVSILTNKRMLPIEVNLPINHWLKTGKNKITLNLFFDDEENLPSGLTCDIKLLIRPTGTAISEARMLTNLRFEGDENLSSPEIKLDTSTLDESALGGVIIDKAILEKTSEKVISLSRLINCPLKFPPWNWLSSEKISDTDYVKEDLHNQYKLIYSLFQKKDIVSLNRLLNERTRELGLAYYRTQSEMIQLTGLSEAFNDTEMALFSPDPIYKLKIMGDGRLARITARDGKALIGFIYNDRSAALYYDFIFRKEAGQWVLSR